MPSVCQSLHPEFFLSCTPLAWLLSLLLCHVFLLLLCGWERTPPVWSIIITVEPSDWPTRTQNSFSLTSYSWGAERAFSHKVRLGFPTVCGVLSCLSHKSASFPELFFCDACLWKIGGRSPLPAGSPFPLFLSGGCVWRGLPSDGYHRSAVCSVELPHLQLPDPIFITVTFSKKPVASNSSLLKYVFNERDFKGRSQI